MGNQPATGRKKKLDDVLDFACDSGSLLLNVRYQLKKDSGHIGKIYGQEKNITTYNLAPKSAVDFAFYCTGFSLPQR